MIDQDRCCTATTGLTPVRFIAVKVVDTNATTLQTHFLLQVMVLHCCSAGIYITNDHMVTELRGSMKESTKSYHHAVHSLYKKLVLKLSVHSQKMAITHPIQGNVY